MYTFLKKTPVMEVPQSLQKSGVPDDPHTGKVFSKI